MERERIQRAVDAFNAPVHDVPRAMGNLIKEAQMTVQSIKIKEAADDPC